MPMIDIHTIGAGGGSIAYVDQGGAFRVGPRSAGAVPGPAAYGRGGNEPTVTDANLVLGRLDKDDFLGGGMKLDEDARASRDRGTRRRARPGKLEAAEGVLTVINSNMANAIRSRTVQKGIDPRDFALVAFGGAGPLHGAEVAAMLGIPEVIVPPYPGITSAMGLLTTDLKYDAIRTQFQVSGNVDLDRLNADLAAMEARPARGNLPPIIWKPPACRFVRDGDLRYVGQGYELKIPLAGRRHRQARARARSGSVSTRRTSANTAMRSAATRSKSSTCASSASAQMPKITKLDRAGRRDAWRRRASEPASACSASTASCARSKPASTGAHLLPVGEIFTGPAIVLQKDSTTVVPPGCSAINDPAGNLILTIAGVCRCKNGCKTRTAPIASSRIRASTRSPAPSSRARWRTSPSRWATSSCA